MPEHSHVRRIQTILPTRSVTMREALDSPARVESPARLRLVRWDQLQFLQQQLKAFDQELRTFAERRGWQKREAPAILASSAGSRAGHDRRDLRAQRRRNVRRFRRANRIVAYAGLDPGPPRDVPAKGKQLSITKDGSPTVALGRSSNRPGGW